MGTHAQHTQWLTQEHPQQVEHAVDSVRAAATVVDVVVAVDEADEVVTVTLARRNGSQSLSSVVS